MSGSDIVSDRPIRQIRNPSSRRQKKFQSKRTDEKMSSIRNRRLSGSTHHHGPIEHDVSDYIIGPTLVHSVPQSAAYDDNSACCQHSYIESKKGHSKTFSSSSGFTTATSRTGQTNKNFYAPKKPSSLNPTAHSWKSPTVKLEEDFARMHKIVSFIAPEQFKNPAKPTDGPCDIVPATLSDFVAHRQAMTKMSGEQMQKNITWMKSQIAARESHGAIRSVLGKAAKIHDSGFSPVLCVPTIWANEFEHFNFPRADWPSQSELQFNGDNRQKLATRCGRYLPPPRLPVPRNVRFYEVPILPVLSFDQTGPIFDGGPTPIRIQQANVATNIDTAFEIAGRAWLGNELMEEIDDW